MAAPADQLNPWPPQVCAHCERDDVGSAQAGGAQIGALPLCQPPDAGRMDCHLLVTRFHHPLPCHWCRQLFGETHEP